MRINFVVIIAATFFASCKTARPVVDVEGQSPSRTVNNGRVFPESPAIPGSPIVETGGQDTPEVKYFGLGLSDFIKALKVKTKEDLPLSKDEEGIYTYGCRPYVTGEWKSSGLEIAEGKIFGVDLIFQDDKCTGKPLRTSREEGGVSYGEYSAMLTELVVKFKKNSLAWILYLPNGESMTLGRVGDEMKPLPSDDQKEEGAIVMGFGAASFAQKILGETKAPDPLLKYEKPLSFLGECQPFSMNESYREGITIKGGLLHGVTYSYGNKACLGDMKSLAIDSSGINFLDFLVAFNRFELRLGEDLKSWVLIFKDKDGSRRATILSSEANYPKVFGLRVDGIGLVNSVAERLGVSPESDAVSTAGWTLYFRNCEAFTSKTFRSIGIFAKDGKIRGGEAFFHENDCSGKPILLIQDTAALSRLEFEKVLESENIHIEYLDDSLELTYPTGATVSYQLFPSSKI